MGGHREAREREHGPHLPELQADGDGRGVPGRAVVRPVGVGDRVGGEAEGAADEGDQERASGDAGGVGRGRAGERDPRRPHRQPVRAPGGPVPQHRLAICECCTLCSGDDAHMMTCM